MSLAEIVQEFITYRYSDGIIFVSESVRREAQRKYKNEHNKVLILGNQIYKGTRIKERYDKLSSKDGKIHCVYEGGISPEKWHHRYYEKIFFKLASADIEIHFYNNQLNEDYYRKLEELHPGIHYEGNKTYEELICELTKYDIGLLAFNVTEKNYKQLFAGSPNKMYDYLQAGIPVAAAELEHCIEFLEQNSVGGGLDLNGDIYSQLKEIAALKVPDNFLDDNHLTMQQKAEELIHFYESVAFSY